MKKTKPFLILGLLFLAFSMSFFGCAQDEKIVEKKVLQIGDREFADKNEVVYKTREFRGRERTYLATDLSQIEKPGSVDEFTQHFHLPPIQQFRTGTCWCFAATSLLESELQRLGEGEFKLSEMFTVYWEFVEKAREYIRTKGEMYLGHGSEHNAVFRQMKKYGAVPASAYSGLLEGQTEHDHGPLFSELENYLKFCKDNEYWDEEKAVSYVKGILDKHLGPPPETVEVFGEKMTPREYLEKVLKLNLDDYVSLMSFKYLPFYAKGEFKVPDNWWHSEDYHNVPLDEFYAALVSALKDGYTVALGGDISEPGISGDEDIAILPSFDTIAPLIDQDSREFRYSNRTSTDDHAIHAVGIKELGDHTWFLIKDSGGSAHRGQHKGYYLYRDDFVKLKMLCLTVHKDAAADLLSKISEQEAE